MFFPPIATLIKTIDNEFLEGLQFMKLKLLLKYLTKSPATAKGRMKRPRKGIRSTRTIPQDRVTYVIPNIEDQGMQLIPYYESPTEEYTTVTVNNIYCFVALEDKEKGTLYMDATGALLSISLNGHHYLLFLHIIITLTKYL